jgi:hypothetical protein
MTPPGRRTAWSSPKDTLQIREWLSVSHLVRAGYRTVELRGLEPLTFSLRRHGVDLIRREHGVIDVQVAAAGAPWLHRGGTHGAHG